MDRIRTSLLAVAVWATAGCSGWESNAVDLAPVDGSPVVIENVSMRHSLYASLGGAPTRLSSSDAPNAVSVRYDARVVGAAAAHSAIGSRMTCLVGERAVRRLVAHDASDRLAAASVGAVINGSETAPPSPFAAEIPSSCEVEFRYQVQPPLTPGPDVDAPQRPAPVALGTVCLSDGVLHDRACTDQELPRTPAAAPLQVTGVDGRVGKTASGSNGLALSVMITAGEEPPPAWRASATARCQTADGERELSIPLLLIERDLRAGESVVRNVATPARFGLSEEPIRCTVALQMSVDEVRTPLATYCVEGDNATPGACGS